MVKIFHEAVFVGDYGLMVDLETNFGKITFQTNYPRLNKWLGVRSICSFEIEPGLKVGYVGNIKLPVKNSSQFLHRVLMMIKKEIIYSGDTTTWEIVLGYRRECG